MTGSREPFASQEQLSRWGNSHSIAQNQRGLFLRYKFGDRYPVNYELT
jgi:hypothetical protein